MREIHSLIWSKVQQCYSHLPKSDTQESICLVRKKRDAIYKSTIPENWLLLRPRLTRQLDYSIINPESHTGAGQLPYPFHRTTEDIVGLPPGDPTIPVPLERSESCSGRELYPRQLPPQGSGYSSPSLISSGTPTRPLRIQLPPGLIQPGLSNSQSGPLFILNIVVG